MRIGDTLAEGRSFEFEGVPRFSPEHFVQVTLKDPMKRKQLKKGLQQLSEEGAVQLFFDRHRLERDPILGAVGVLQFEVIEHRLESEYKVAIQLRTLPYKYARWVEGEPFSPATFDQGRGTTCVSDAEGEWVRPVRERLGAPGGAGGSPAPAILGGRTARPRRRTDLIVLSRLRRELITDRRRRPDGRLRRGSAGERADDSATRVQVARADGGGAARGRNIPLATVADFSVGSVGHWKKLAPALWIWVPTSVPGLVVDVDLRQSEPVPGKDVEAAPPWSTDRGRRTSRSPGFRSRSPARNSPRTSGARRRCRCDSRRRRRPTATRRRPAGAGERPAVGGAPARSARRTAARRKDSALDLQRADGLIGAGVGVVRDIGRVVATNLLAAALVVDVLLQETIFVVEGVVDEAAG